MDDVFGPNWFQSTLPHGERLKYRGSMIGDYMGFNPRSRTGSDSRPAIRSPRLMRFQSTLPHGERPYSGTNTLTGELFQSTLPHGERPLAMSRQSAGSGFNPRSRTGSDEGKPVTLTHPPVSIHAPARGATAMIQMPLQRPQFQSTLPHGERHEHTAKCADWAHGFNPRSRTGSD